MLFYFSLEIALKLIINRIKNYIRIKNLEDKTRSFIKLKMKT